MKITHISIQNYRSLKDVSIDVDDYTAFIGANGSGKSCVLYALDWFFKGARLQASDVTGYKDNEIAEDGEEKTISVTVAFGSLTDQDRKRLKQYGRGEIARFRRSWTLGDEKDKVVGNATQGPGFAEIRQMTRVTDIRPAYRNLRTSIPDLPDLGSTPPKDEVLETLATWESEPSNTDKLVNVSDDDANHMFGYNGPNIINDCVRLVLVPAAADIVSQVGSSGGGTALNELIGSLMSKASAEARTEWLTEHADKIEELNKLVRKGVETSTGLQASRMNSQLAQLVPNASVKFTPSVPEWTPKNDATIATDVTIDGITNDVSRQGHGIQRAVMIAMLQSLVPDEVFASGNHRQAKGETEEEAKARLLLEIQSLPTLIICIEEPEIYQHPIRARAFARTLTELTSQPTAQVIVATHSPYFILPSQFMSLRRFRLDKGETKTKATNISNVASMVSCSNAQVEKIVEKRLPTTFSEGFFCDTVVVVEGETDKTVIETLADKLDLSLDDRGISVIEMSSKSGLKIPFSIFQALGILSYVVVDGDALGANRKYPNDAARRAQAHGSHENATNDILTWLPVSNAQYGTLPYIFNNPTVVADHFTIWEDDIEEELGKWASFVLALTANGSQLRSKDLLAYRTAVIDADTADCPEQLRKCIDTIASFNT